MHDGDERGRRLLAAQGPQQRGHAVLREPLQADPLRQAVAEQVFERPGEAVAGRHLGVAVRAHRQHRQAGKALGEVLDEEERPFVGPVEVVEHEEHRPPGGGPAEEVPQAVEEVVALLLRRQLQRRRDVGEEPPEAGQQLRHLGGVVGEERPEGVRARSGGQRLLKDLDEGHVGRRPFDLVAAADEHPETLGGGVGSDLLGEPGLADTGFSPDERQGPPAVAGGVEEAGQLGPFDLPADVGGAGGEGRR